MSYVGSASNAGQVKSIGGPGNGGTGINFRVSKAIGGYIVSAHGYDPRSGCTQEYVYVLTDDQDLGEEVSKIVSALGITL